MLGMFKIPEKMSLSFKDYFFSQNAYRQSVEYITPESLKS